MARVANVLAYLHEQVGGHRFIGDALASKKVGSRNFNGQVEEDIILVCAEGNRHLIPANSEFTVFRHPLTTEANTVACFFHAGRREQTVVAAHGHTDHQRLDLRTVYDHSPLPSWQSSSGSSDPYA